MIKVSQPAPAFTAPNQNNNPIDLGELKGKYNIVLYFYPKDDTTGCTIEANQFTTLADEFKALDTMIVGVSKDSCESHRNFINKYKLNVELLSDQDGSLCESYGVWQEKEKNGEKKMGIVRSTFVINKDGIVTYAEYNVQADGHASNILNQVKSL